jgi:pilin isopeptide linkage protein
MKKFFAILLALVLTLSLGVTAFAVDEVTPTEEPAAASGTTVQPAAVEVTKEYTLTGGAAAPVEELTFTVTPDTANMPAEGELVVGTQNKVTTSGEAKTKFNITFPTYSKVGVYKYTVTEVAGSTAGVTYDTRPIVVVVTVTNATNKDDATGGTTDTLAASVAIHKGSATGEKINDTDKTVFTNTYGQGQLTVKKEVSGNLASNVKKFTIHVTFTGTNVKSPISYSVADVAAQPLDLSSGTAVADIELSSEQSAVFTNIPAGVTYTVEEDSKHTTGDPLTTEEGYTVTYTKSDAEGKIAAGDTDSVTVKNEKKTDVDTGISLDSLPYILIVAVVLAASVVMFVTKRRSEV